MEKDCAHPLSHHLLLHVPGVAPLEENDNAERNCRHKGKNPKEEAKRGSYYKPDISREDALKASKKMFQQATANPREVAKVLLTTRKQPINVSPLPIKKMHPMTYQAPPGKESPTGNSRPDMYCPLKPRAVAEYLQ